MPNSNTRKHDKASSDDLEAIRDALVRLNERLDARIAKGTRDVTRDAREAVVMVDPGPPAKIKVGDNGTTDELARVVEYLIVERPRTFRELLEMTGARQGRVSGVLEKLKLARPVVNAAPRGEPFLWWIPDAEVADRIAATRRG